MFEKNIKPVYFETRFGIHTFFVKYPIDVLIMDDKNIVRVIKKSLKPWRVYFWKPTYFKILELPAGEVKRNEIKVGSNINLI